MFEDGTLTSEPLFFSAGVVDSAKISREASGETIFQNEFHSVSAEIVWRNLFIELRREIRERRRP